MGGVGAQYKKSLGFGRWRLPNIHGTSSVALVGVVGCHRVLVTGARGED